MSHDSIFLNSVINTATKIILKHKVKETNETVLNFVFVCECLGQYMGDTMLYFCNLHQNVIVLTSYDTPLSVPASHGIRSWYTFWAQPHSLVHRSSADRPTFQSGLGPSMVRKDMRWRDRSTENSAEGAARLRKRVSMSADWIKAVLGKGEGLVLGY